MTTAPAANGKMIGNMATSLQNINSLVSDPSATTFAGRAYSVIANVLL